MFIHTYSGKTGKFLSKKSLLYTVTITSGLLRIYMRVYYKNMAEEEGFEPPRAVKPLAVFKTAPFSRTWVLLRVTDN